MGRSASDLRSQARDMERDARELDEVVATIKFLTEHLDLKPSVSVEFSGFKSDGAKAAEQIEKWVREDWDARREQLLEHFRARRKELEERWA